MGRIHLLDPHTIGQIRAGEVIERPASIVKELVENSIDAGARSINVRISGGGVTEIVVQDDGEGMSPEDALLAVQRHATSKLTQSADLFALSTLGFRGEGLASIAAVAQVELTTREPASVEGLRVQIAGDAPAKMAPAAAPPGTTVVVRHLFFNTPPRRAFLKSPTSEGNQIEEMLIGLALSRPEIRFQFTWDQRAVFDALPQDTLAGRVKAVLGKEWAEGLLPVSATEELSVESGIGMSGLVSPPDRHRNTRTGQYFFVNKRLVKSQPLSFALSRGYGELLPQGRFPLAVLFLTAPRQSVDVNVHPTKREVKFQDERAVLHVLVHGVRSSLDRANLFKTATLPMPAAPDGFAASTSWALSPDIPMPDPEDFPARRKTAADVDRSDPLLRLVPKPPPVLPVAPNARAAGALGMSAQPTLWRRPDGAEFRIVGQSHELFVLVEVEGELWVVDQHASHERVVYEQVLDTLHHRKGDSQPLLLPITFELAPTARAALEEAQEYLTALGFDIQPFGGGTYQVQATPPYFRASDTPELIIELAQARAEGRSDNSVEAKIEDLAARVACKVKSVKAGQTLTPEAMKALVKSLLDCRSPFVCPHGRPTMVRLAVQQLAAQFDRR
ncbi:MAG: DNA mismatch repair endonuclease MutL [Deltaproteobacteria bacterium]|nr:DNA mismatch repair endonuclease MutL [Deltaproteobacteria bacterium]